MIKLWLGAFGLSFYEGCKKRKPPPKNLSHLWQTIYVAQEVGKGLGRG
jgi:hypothetical protein